MSSLDPMPSTLAKGEASARDPILARSCSDCLKPSKAGANFCGYCGGAIFDIPTSDSRCASCGKVRGPENRFCSGCASAYGPLPETVHVTQPAIDAVLKRQSGL